MIPIVGGSTRIRDDPWGSTLFYSYLVLQPEEMLVEFNGNPIARKTLTELAEKVVTWGARFSRAGAPRAAS